MNLVMAPVIEHAVSIRHAGAEISLQLGVGGENADPGGIDLGAYHVLAGRLAFVPRFACQRGYLVVVGGSREP